MTLMLFGVYLIAIAVLHIILDVLRAVYDL